MTAAEGRAIFFDTLLFISQTRHLQARPGGDVRLDELKRDTTVMANKTANA